MFDAPDDGPAVNPSRLVLARARRGLTQGALAERIGVDRRSVAGFERGEYLPSPDTLARMVSALAFPVEFFCGDDLDMPQPDAASFRSMAKMSATQRDMALGQGALALHFCAWLEERFHLPAAGLPDLSQEPNPEVAAESLRQAWGIGQLPVRNAIHLLEAKGVRVFSLAIDAREVDAYSMWRGTTPFVFLNTQKSAEHSRYDAAHELGHLVLHRHGGPQGRELEQEANRFAAAFLMPRAAILAHAPRSATLQSLMGLKRWLGVSLAALNRRLYEVGLLSDWHYRVHSIEIAKRGFRTSEPEGLPRESSHLLPKLLAYLHQKEGIPRSGIAAALSVPLSELEQLLFGLAMTGVEGGRVSKPSSTEDPTRPSLNRVK